MQYFFCAVYDIIYFVGLILSLPVFKKRLFGRDRLYHDFFERCGIYDTTGIEKHNRNIWIHAVSIGELLAILPLVREISQKFSDRKIIISCVSRTGRFIAEQKLGKDIVKIFLPFDFSFITRKAVSTINPEIFISVETEIWPNLFLSLKRRNVPILVLNGRISRKSFRRYYIFRFVIRCIFNMVDCFVMRSQADAERILKLGVEKEKIVVSKSIKFDYAYQLSKTVKTDEPKDSRIIVFGSIHRSEETQIVKICKKILDRFKDVLLFIVPRALDKTNIYDVLNSEGISYERWSHGKNKSRVIVVDRYGILTELYRKCDIAFVGGSLVPAGGQNPIEPLAFKKPVIYGKFHWDFEQEWERIKQAKGGIEVGSWGELYDRLVFLLQNPDICKKMGDAGFKVVLDNKGAMHQMLETVEKFLA